MANKTQELLKKMKYLCFRIPAVFINSNEYLTVRHALGKENHGDNFKLPIGIWNFIEISSLKEDNEVSPKSHYNIKFFEYVFD